MINKNILRSDFWKLDTIAIGLMYFSSGKISAMSFNV